jgi:hypothetical protein
MARHAALTPDRPEKRPLPSGFYDDGAVLALVKLDEDEEQDQNRRASREVARRTLYAVHGCAGTRRRLSPEGVVMDEALYALGLVADPESFERWHWGKAPKGAPSED